MSDKNAKTQPVRIDCDVVEKVRQHKQKEGTPISKFFEKAALEKLDREKLKSKK